jgi:hypothetical protein
MAIKLAVGLVLGAAIGYGAGLLSSYLGFG